MKIQDFKGLPYIYALPTGNNRTTGEEQNGRTVFKVVKVGRKYVEMVIVHVKGCHSIYTNKYNPVNGRIVGGDNNAGWIFFPSKDSMLDHLLRKSLVRDIQNTMEALPSTGGHMTTDDLLNIRSILIAGEKNNGSN